VRKITCDAEINAIEPGEWRRCGRPAKWRRATISGGTLHYCEGHRDRAFNPTHAIYIPAPFSTPERITEES